MICDVDVTTLAVTSDITQALADTCGNKKEAARRLGISRRALYRRIEKFGLDAAIARAA